MTTLLRTVRAIAGLFAVLQIFGLLPALKWQTAPERLTAGTYCADLASKILR